VTSQDLLYPARASSARLTELVCVGLIIAYAAFLGAAYAQGVWLVDAQGRGIATDFVNVWAAGHLTLDGHPELAYDWVAHKDTEVAAVGQPFEKYFGWHYPPPFLAIAALLALVPHNAAFVLWMAITLPAYAATVRSIVGDRIGWLVALAFPGVLWNIAVGQNGFLSAALLGSALLFMPGRPLLAGIFLGLLVYKPQFGLLFPLVFAVAGYWRVFASAAAVATAVLLASWLAFGSVAWEAFFASVPLTNALVLDGGLADWAKLQSLFGFVRALGGSASQAWAAQIALAVAAALACCALWRSSRPFELKAAALATGALLATPYLYIYDLAVLAVPIAFLVRLALRDGFRPYEPAAIAGAGLLVLVYPVAPVPSGLIATALVALLIARRVVSPAAQPVTC
jgi:hypothetical protein